MGKWLNKVKKFVGDAASETAQEIAAEVTVEGAKGILLRKKGGDVAEKGEKSEKPKSAIGKAIGGWVISKLTENRDDLELLFQKIEIESERNDEKRLKHTKNLHRRLREASEGGTHWYTEEKLVTLLLRLLFEVKDGKMGARENAEEIIKYLNRLSDDEFDQRMCTVENDGVQQLIGQIFQGATSILRSLRENLEKKGVK